jgi:1-acyl-sn-glycerol-3-phosphate acyltransferase
MFIGAAVVLSAWPLWIMLGLFWDVASGRLRKLSATRVALLLPCTLLIECVGLVALGLVFVFTLGAPTRRASATWRVQQTYTRAHLFAVSRAFSLRFEVEGDALAAEGPLLVFIRHASLLDVLLPGAFLAAKHNLHLRYVLKRELLMEPCLDIAGHWLPNHFVARDGADTARELSAIRALAEGMQRNDGVLLYPEGTFFSEAKRERAIAQASDADARAHAESLTHLLPCRPGGANTLLDAAPNADVLFVGHVGFDGLRTVSQIARGDLVGRTIRLRYWRVPASQIPRDAAARTDWLRAQWLMIDAWVNENISQP